MIPILGVLTAQAKTVHIAVLCIAVVCVCVCVLDRCTLQDRHTVEQCQMLLLECLLYLCAKNHANDPLFFARIVAVLVQMRTGSVAHSLADERFITEWRDKVDFPPLFLEIWS